VANKAHRSGSGLLLRPGPSSCPYSPECAWKDNSAKLDFRFTEFCELRACERPRGAGRIQVGWAAGKLDEGWEPWSKAE
jgi:hypothetical protein